MLVVRKVQVGGRGNDGQGPDPELALLVHVVPLTKEEGGGRF